MATDSIYFIILIPSEERINFDDIKFLSENEPENVYNEIIQIKKDSFLYQNVFKLKIKEKEKSKRKVKYKIQYEIDEKVYDILFEVKENTFIYEIQLLKGNKFLDNIVKRKIEQNQIPLHNKLKIFIEALKKNNEISKIDILYEETIDLYKAKKNLNLLIYLFLKIYEKNNKLCSKLIDTFKEINGEEIVDNDKDLVIELDTINKIYTKANSLIEENKYDPINFY